MSHVLFCRLDNAGDVLLTGPAVRAVAATADRVSFLCGPKGAEAAFMLPGVDEVVTYRAPWIDPDGTTQDVDAIGDLVDELRELQLSEAFISTSYHQSPLPTALVLRMARVPVIAAISDDFPGSLLDVRHRLDPDIHEVERNLSLAATLGYRLPAHDDGRLHIAPGVEPPRLPGPPFVVVHPGATVPARTAAPDLFREVARLLMGEGWRVVVTGSPREVDLTRFVAEGRLGITDLGGQTNLSQLAAVIAGASAVIVGNTGPAHIAAAVGTPVVQLFPPTVPHVRWRPWAVPHELLGDQEISCAGCRAAQCPLPHQECLAIEPRRVVDALRRVLSNRDQVLPAPAVAGVWA